MIRCIYKKKNNILSVIILIVFVFFSVPVYTLKAEGQRIPGPLYLDRDFVDVNLYRSSDEKMYTIAAESRENGGVDWLVYVIKLNNNDFSSIEDYLLKSYDNRTIFPSEDNVVEVLYAPAKSWAKNLDITGNAIDFLLKEGGYNTVDSVADSVDVPIDDNAIYIIRAYSGALGLRDDKEEWKFVYDSVDRSKERLFMASATNIVSLSMDIASVYYSTENMLEKEGFLKAAGKSMTKISPRITVYFQQKQSKKELLKIVQETTETIMKDFADYLIMYSIEYGKVKALNKWVSLTSNSMKAALDVVNITDKISKGGQVFDRVSSFVYSATPLETSYISSDAVARNIIRQDDKLLGDAIVFVDQIQAIHPSTSDNSETSSSDEQPDINNDSQNEESDIEINSEELIDDNSNSQPQEESNEQTNEQSQENQN